MEVGERIPGGYVYVDGNWVGSPISADLVRRRQELGQTGVCSVAFAYDEENGKMVGNPSVTARAVVAPEAMEALEPDALNALVNAMRGISPGTAASTVERAVQSALSDFFFRESRNRPEVIVQAIPVASA